MDDGRKVQFLPSFSLSFLLKAVAASIVRPSWSFSVSSASVRPKRTIQYKCLGRRSVRRNELKNGRYCYTALYPDCLAGITLTSAMSFLSFRHAMNDALLRLPSEDDNVQRYDLPWLPAAWHLIESQDDRERERTSLSLSLSLLSPPIPIGLDRCRTCPSTSRSSNFRS